MFTSKEFKESKSRDLLPLRCKKCQKTFHRKKHQIQSVIKNKWQGHTYEFCSKSCQKRHQIPPVKVKCTQCDNSFEKWPSQAKRSNNHFCSKSCSTIWRNTHKKHGTRRSKLETWLEEQLTNLYPNLEIHFNRKDAIESELDIFIPSLMLAFELNGIFHYEPIYGQEKLDKIQSNDRIKFTACYEKRIELCIVDSSMMKYFKPAKAQKFLDIITNIIDSRLSDS